LYGAGYRLLCPVRDPASPTARALAEDLDAAVQDGPSARTASLPGTADASPQVRLVPLDLSRVEALAEHLPARSVDAVISCIATRSGAPDDAERVEYLANARLLAWARGAGVGHFTLLSAICVQKPRLAFQHAKLRFERELAASGMPHSIVRPTAFFKSLSGQVERVRRGKPFLLFGSGDLTACKPIAESDLARYLRLTLEDPALQGILPVGGPGPALTPRDQAGLLAQLANQPLRTRSVPPALLSGIAAILQLGAGLSQRLAAKAEFARIGHYYATESMLLWDEKTGRYDADATPEFGELTLADSYRAQLAGEQKLALGEHAMFQ
jgi:divinyl chlorophyllide a 8-vinyl-reductase